MRTRWPAAPALAKSRSNSSSNRIRIRLRCPRGHRAIREGRLLGDREMTRYCLGLFDGTLAHQPEIDAKLTATATNWRLSRMQPS